MGIAAHLLLLGLVLCGLEAHAELMADPNAPTINTPNIGAAGNGIPLVDIARPNTAGVSHNQFTKLSVDASGVILNNSTLAVQPTTLGGLITGNPNFAGQSATVIINEVTSTNPSILRGFIEVAGPGADIVVANPNGVTCNGCGFINTPRATLTTGIPKLDQITGALKTLDVDGGNVSITGTGANTLGVNYFDIISRTASIIGQIDAKNLGVYVGRNQFDYNTKAAIKKAPNGSSKPALAIDGSALGAMYTDRIIVVATEDGVGVNMPSMQAAVDDIVITADGGIEARQSYAAGKTKVTSASSGVKVSSEILSTGPVEINAATKIEATEGSRALSQSDITLKAPEVDITQSLVAAGSADTGGANNPAVLTILTDKLKLLKSYLFTSNSGQISSFSGAKTEVDSASSFIEAMGDFAIVGKSFDQYMSKYEYIPAVQKGDVLTTQNGSANLQQTYIVYRTTTYEDQFTAMDMPPLINVSGNLTMDLDNINNQLGHIWAGGALDIKSSSVNNKNLNIFKRFKQENTTNTWKRVRKRTIFQGNHYGHVAEPPASVEVPSQLINTVYSTISATAGIMGANADQIVNEALNKDITAQIGNFKKDSAATSFNPGLTFSSPALYKTNPASGATYLYEARTNFVDVSKFVNSAAFLTKFPVPNNITLKLLGDAYVEQQHILSQVRNQAGLGLLGGYADYNSMATALFNNADTFATATGIPTGTKLTQAQVDSISSDMIWMEFDTINGELVLTPKVYLSTATKNTLARQGAVIRGGSVALGAGTIANSGSILSDTTLTLNAQDVVNSGDIKGIGAVSITASDTVQNISGTISGSTVSMTAGKIINQTAKERKSYAYGYNDVIGRTATIRGDTQTTLTAAGDIVNQGALITSGGNLQATAGGDIYNVALEKETYYGYNTRRQGRSTYSLTNQAAEINSAGATTINAGGDVHIIGSSITGQTGDVEAGGRVMAQESVDIASSSSWFKNKNIFSKKVSSNSSEAATVNKSTLAFQNGYTLKSGAGDTVLQATDITSSGAGVHDNPAGGTVYKVAKGDNSFVSSVNRKNLARYKNVAKSGYNESITQGNINVQGGITYLGANPIVEYNAKALAPAVPGATFLAIQEDNSHYYGKQSGFTREFATFGGVVASIATMGAASSVGLAAMTAASLEGTALGVGVQNAAAVAVTSTASGITRNSILASNLGRGVKGTFRRDGLKGIGAASLSAGVTGGIASNLGVSIDNYTIRPVNTTDIAHRATYAAINMASQTATDVAILNKKFGHALTDNLRSNVGTQAQATGASALGAAYAGGAIGYTEHKLAHAGLGAATAGIAGGKAVAGAFGAVTAEVVGEGLFKAGADPYQAADIAKVSGSAAGLVTGDVNTAASSAATAVENNFVPFVAAVGAYVLLTGDGNPLTGVETIGASEDMLSKGIENAMQKGVELSYQKYPKETALVLDKLSMLGKSVNSVVKYADKKTGKVVSTNWNKLTLSEQNLIKGSLTIISVIIPATKQPLPLPKKLDKAAHRADILILSEKEARKLEGANKGLVFINETPRGGKAAVNFQEGTTGAMSSVKSRNPVVPALRYDNPKGVNYIKFDGFEPLPKGGGMLLIDAKTNLPFWSKSGMKNISDTIKRVEEALAQNPGYKVVYEFPDQKTAAKAQKFVSDIEKTGVVSIRVRGE